MGRLSTRSNPTSLKEIEKRRVEIVVSIIDSVRYFSLQRLDLSDMNFPATHRVICVARAGKTSQRFDMGSVVAQRRESIPLDEIDTSESLRFRILIHDDANPQLVASAENLRPRDESESESLLPMEPADLGQLLWKLDFNSEGPLLKFNSAVFPNAAGVENYLPFAALVLPEAVRKVVEKIAEQPDVLDDEDEPLSYWGDWIDSFGLERPHNLDDDDRVEWCSRIVDAFCNRHSFATRLGVELTARSNVDD